eukprot:gene10049-11078_t
MRPETLITIRPLSPRLASLEKSLSRKEHPSPTSPESNSNLLSPRILTKTQDLSSEDSNNNTSDINQHLVLPQSTLFDPRRSFPILFSLEETAEEKQETDGFKLVEDTRLLKIKMPKDIAITEEDEAQRRGGEKFSKQGVMNHQRGGFRDKEGKAAVGVGVGRLPGLSRIPKLSLQKDQNINNNTAENNTTTGTEAQKKTLENSPSNSSDSTDIEPLSLHSARSERSTGVTSDVSLKDVVPNKDPSTGQQANMERKTPLLSTLPKKLREETVLKTFASTLRLASSASKGFSTTSRRQPLDGRLSADSGRESYGGGEHEEDKPKLYRFDSHSSISSNGSTARAERGNNSSNLNKPWNKTMDMVIESIKKRRQLASTDGRKSLNELDTLKATLEQVQAKSSRLETELDPMKEKLRRYEGIIESLEDRIEESKQEILERERSRFAEIDKVERRYSKQLEEERTAKEDIEDDLRNEIRKYQSETKLYKKLADELEDNLATLKENSVVDEENSPMAKQLASLRDEVVKVREVLATSEKERLNERKEKLSALQNMIKLTKAKSDIEEELDERKKADTKESSEKYMQLSSKLAVTEKKLKELRVDMSTEIENLQRKHAEEIRELTKSHEKAISSTKKELDEANEKLKNLEEKSRPSSPSKNKSYPGRWSAMRSENRKHQSEMKEIIAELDKEDLGPDKSSSDEVVRVLFNRHKEVADKLKDAEEILSACKNGDPRPVIEKLKEERKTLRRKVDDLKQNLSSVESQLKLTEMTSKRQMGDLITEKKNSFLELQRCIDDRDNAKSTNDQLQKELLDSKSVLKRRQKELDMLRDNLMSVTNEMKTVDADLGKTRKDLSIKEAQLERQNRDMALEKERIEQEKKMGSRLQSDVESKKRVIKESEKLIAELETKAQRLTENLQASQMHANRALSERDLLKDEVHTLKTSLISNEAEIKQSNSVIASLRNQIQSLEYAFHEKTEKAAQTSTELEKAKARSLGISHLLGIEETKNKELETEIDNLTAKLKSKCEELEITTARTRTLEEESLNLRSSLDNIQVDFAETETSLKSNASTRSILEKELNLLQVQHRDVTREKQRLHDILEETKRSLQQKNEKLLLLDKELIDNKHHLKENIRKLDETESERNTIKAELAFQRQQNEALNENLDVTKLECRKQLADIDQLRSELAQLGQRRGSLNDELKRLKEDFEIKSNKNQKKISLLQKENDQLYAEFKAAQALLYKYSSLNGVSSDFTDGMDDSTNDKNITSTLNTFIKRLDKAEQDGQMYHTEADKLKLRVQTLNSELQQTRSLMSNEKVSLSKEIDKVREEISRQVELERRRYNDDMKAANDKHAMQKKEIAQLRNNLTEAEDRTSQMEKLIIEKESQLSMIAKEKEQLLDSVEFLQKEMKNSDSKFAEKENEFKRIAEEKEAQISSLSKKQKQILAELQDANDQLMLKEEDHNVRSQKVNDLIKSLRNEKEELMANKSELEELVGSLETQVREKEVANRQLETQVQDSKQDFEIEVNKLKRKITQQEDREEEINEELKKNVKENKRLQKKVKELIEESENIGGGEQCQIAQVAQVESAGMEFEMLEAEEKLDGLRTENAELQKQLADYQTELERQVQVSDARRSVYQQNEKQSQKLANEVQKERQEKLEALGCLKALIIDNEAMAKCVSGLQETVVAQRKENTETRRHLKEVLDKYEYQREVSFSTQKTFEDLMESRLSKDQQELTRLHNDLGLIRTDFEEIRRERDKLAKQLAHKDSELDNTRSEISELRDIMERKVINFEVEKRARELLESKMQHLANDRMFAHKRLDSIEDSNKNLQGRLHDMQKRHNNLEQNLTKRTDTSPLSFKALYEDQQRRERFLNDQVTSLADKYDQLGYGKHSPVYKNTFGNNVSS